VEKLVVDEFRSVIISSVDLINMAYNSIIVQNGKWDLQANI